MIPIERTHEFRGRYHVLGGALSPIDGVEPEDLKIAQLYARVERGRASTEVVLATNPTTTGEATALHIADGAARAHARRHRHAARLGPARRRRPRVRRRGHARPRAGRPPRGVTAGAARPSGRIGAVGGAGGLRRPLVGRLHVRLPRARGLRAADLPRAALHRRRGAARPGVRGAAPAAPAQRGRVAPPVTTGLILQALYFSLLYGAIGLDAPAGTAR